MMLCITICTKGANVTMSTLENKEITTMPNNYQVGLLGSIWFLFSFSVFLFSAGFYEGNSENKKILSLLVSNFISCFHFLFSLFSLQNLENRKWKQKPNRLLFPVLFPVFTISLTKS